MDLFESTFWVGTRREAAAEGGGRRAEPPGPGGAGILLKVVGFSRGGVCDFMDGGAIAIVLGTEFDAVASCALVSRLPLEDLPFLEGTSNLSTSLNDIGSSNSGEGPSKVKHGAPSWTWCPSRLSSSVSAFGHGEEAGAMRYR